MKTRWLVIIDNILSNFDHNFEDASAFFFRKRREGVEQHRIYLVKEYYEEGKYTDGKTSE